MESNKFSIGYTMEIELKCQGEMLLLIYVLFFFIDTNKISFTIQKCILYESMHYLVLFQQD